MDYRYDDHLRTNLGLLAFALMMNETCLELKRLGLPYWKAIALHTLHSSCGAVYVHYEHWIISSRQDQLKRGPPITCDLKGVFAYLRPIKVD